MPADESPEPIDYAPGVEPPIPPTVDPDPETDSEPEQRPHAGESPLPKRKRKKVRPRGRSGDEREPTLLRTPMPLKVGPLAERCGPILAWCPWCGLVFWIAWLTTASQVIWFRTSSSLDGAAALAGVLAGLLGQLLVFGSIIAGSLMWAHLGSHPAVRGYRVATVGGILALFIGPMMLLMWTVLTAALSHSGSTR